MPTPPSRPKRAHGLDVASRCLTSLLEVAARRGVGRDTLLRGLARDGFDEQAPFERMAWDDYAVVCDRLEIALGGPAATAAFAHEVVRSSRALRAVAAQLLDLEQLTRFGVERLAPALLRNVGTRVDVTPDRTLRVELALPSAARGSLACMRLHAANVEAYAALLGLADLDARAELSPRGGVVRCALPPARPLRARAADALHARLDALVFDVLDADAAPPPLAHDLPCEGADAALADAANDVGQRLATLEDLDALARRLGRHLASRFLASHVRLLVRRRPGAAFEPVRPLAADEARPRRPIVTRPLQVLGRDVGRLEVDLDPAARPRELELLLPFVALGVDRCLAAATRREDGAADAAARGPERWPLTPRERAVLDLVVRGSSNKDVASTLGCGVKNVERALSLLFRKAGVSNRTALVREVLGAERRQ
jgi:DNA-binding CsgD family transcriptional regulator